MGELVSRTEHDDGTATSYWTEDEPTARGAVEAPLREQLLDRNAVDQYQHPTPRAGPPVAGQERLARHLARDLIQRRLGDVAHLVLVVRGERRPDELCAAVTNNYNSGPATKRNMAPAILDDDPANLFTTFPVYTRSAMMLEGYHQILGDDEAFFESARELLDRFGYGNLSLDEFVEVALEISGKSGDELKLLDDYFDQWLFLEGQRRSCRATSK